MSPRPWGRVETTSRCVQGGMCVKGMGGIEDDHPLDDIPPLASQRMIS